MQRQEIPNHTPEQVREHIIDALELAEELGKPHGLMEAVFVQACGLLAGKQIVMMQPQPIDLGSLRVPGNRH